MNTDILMFEGEKIDLKLIKERHKNTICSLLHGEK